MCAHISTGHPLLTFKAQTEEETEKVRTSFEKEMLEPTNELVDLLELPDGKMTPDQVLELTKVGLPYHN